MRPGVPVLFREDDETLGLVTLATGGIVVDNPVATGTIVNDD